MAKLSKKEQAQLDALTAKAEAPEQAAPNASLSISIDLGDPEQIERAQKLGFFTSDDEDEDEAEDDDADPPPTRRGYFDE